MRLTPSLRLSPTDLSNFHACRHRSGLDLGVAAGEIEKPRDFDPMVERLAALGAAHEGRYVEALRTTGISVEDLRPSPGERSAGDRRPGEKGRPPEEIAARTVEALRRGVGAVVQGCLAGEDRDSGIPWLGFADVLRRVETPSALGTFSYEAYDTKLTRETAAGTILQLSVYSELLEQVQGIPPERFHVVMPGDAADLARGRAFRVESHRFTDTAAVYQRTKARMREALAGGGGGLEVYPEPVEHCAVCRWWRRCEARRRRDDHLSFIAGIRGDQRTEFATRGVTTLGDAAKEEVPLAWRPSRGSKESLERVCHQARLQVETRDSAAQDPAGRGRVALELLPVTPEEGLCLLPEPSPGDVFLDFEGDPFARMDSGGDGGREYLTGLWFGGRDAGNGHYSGRWAFSDSEERAAFEATIDAIVARSEGDPGMHVYHFGHYEPSALKRLMGRHATRGEELDRLLRGERFVDLYRVVRGALRAGVESYSIKELEALTGFEREVDLPNAGRHRRAVEQLLESGGSGIAGAASLPDELRLPVEGYNRDDCRSTEVLRDWLEGLRQRQLEAGVAVSRPVLKNPQPPEELGDLDREIATLSARLLEGVPLEPEERQEGGPAQQVRWLLAHLVSFPRREEKAGWWEYYRLLELPEEDLFDEGAAVAGLRLLADLGPDKRSRRLRFQYSSQEMNLRVSGRRDLTIHSPRPGGGGFGKIVALDREARTVDLRVGPTAWAAMTTPPTALFSVESVSPAAIQQSLLALARGFADRLLEGRTFDDDASLTSAALRLLLRRPREVAEQDPLRRLQTLDRDVLAIQGPPGSGKTWHGAQMILEQIRLGKRVGVVAVSHKVIDNLIQETLRQASQRGQSLRIGRRVSEAPVMPDERVDWETDQPTFARKLLAGEWELAGATAWAWSAADLGDSIDTLFVDEAGQMSLAVTLAASQAARNLVLLGDPQQLDQPQKASHPDGVDVSALQHLLGDAVTLPEHLGIFLEETRRLAPPICELTSELFYGGKLRPKAGLGLERQVLGGTAGAGIDRDSEVDLDGAGLWWCPVEHGGRTSWSPEEIDAVERIVGRLLPADDSRGGGWWIDQHGTRRPLAGPDILVVAPFNAHVTRLQERLAARPATRGVRVGTVDKFQGQEAPVVLYTMASSTAAAAPRGMEFLFSTHRFNVATSRARCAVVLVASPGLLDADCRTPRQMRLANALCRFVERARRVNAS